jgi:hypothetical protein
MVLSLPIYLYFPAVVRNERAISFELGGEIPIELGPSCIPVLCIETSRTPSFRSENCRRSLRHGFAHCIKKRPSENINKIRRFG